MDRFWANRKHDACIWGMCLTLINIMFQTINLFRPKTDQDFIMSSIYMIGSMMSATSFVLYYKKRFDTIYYTMIWVCIRNSIRILDLEKTRSVIKHEQWQTIFVLNVIASTMNVIFLSKCFPQSRIRRVLLYFVCVFVAFCVLCGIVGRNNVIDSNFLFHRFFYHIIMGAGLFLLSMFLLERVNHQFIDEVYLKL